ncbi:hypothetical protein AMECASPLE_032519 [Ameca splendens]|uniref:Uncharacterized protein n=1 Tax=Ameca splendens TaxID=208324 RepID=A0ABV0Y797_9TELE
MSSRTSMTSNNHGKFAKSNFGVKAYMTLLHSWYMPNFSCSFSGHPTTLQPWVLRPFLFESVTNHFAFKLQPEKYNFPQSPSIFVRFLQKEFSMSVEPEQWQDAMCTVAQVLKALQKFTWSTYPYFSLTTLSVCSVVNFTVQ